MRRRPPRSTRTDTLFPYTTLFRSLRALVPRFPAEAFALMVVVPVTVAVGLDGDLQGAFFLGVTMVIYVAWSLRSEEHTSELQSLMRISYAVFCLKKKTNKKQPR